MTLTALLAGAILVAGCVADRPPEKQAKLAVPRPGVESTPVSRVLGFSRWVEGAPAAELQSARALLERAVPEGSDPSLLMRLALILREPRTPGSDPERARSVLARFLEESAPADHAELRSLALLLIGSWREQSLLAQALRDAEEQATQARAALERERKLRVLAEKRLEALIDVERRVKRSGSPIKEVKPATR